MKEKITIDKDKEKKEEKFYTFNYVYHDDDNFVVNIVERGIWYQKKKKEKRKNEKRIVRYRWTEKKGRQGRNWRG